MAYRCLHDAGWTMVFVSDGCRELCGYASSEILGKTGVSWEEITHPEDRGHVRDCIDEATRGGRRFAVQYRIVSKSGQIKWVVERGVAIRDEQGEAALEGFIEDITARRATLEALEAAELRYRNIFEHASEGIFQSTRDGRYLAANPALAKLYGYDSPQALMADLADIERLLYVLPDRREDFLSLIERDGEVLNFESEVAFVAAVGSRENAQIVAQGGCASVLQFDVCDRAGTRAVLEPNPTVAIATDADPLGDPPKAGPVPSTVFADQPLCDALGALCSDASARAVAQGAARALRQVRVAARIDDLSPADLRDLAIAIRQQGIAKVVLVGRSDTGGASLVAAVDPASGVQAADLIKDAAKAVKGGGGGKGDVAVAGGKDPAGLDEALAIATAKATA